ncbi:response regulator transcription factor [Parafrankia sp. EUN1f]|uniref:response regulator transcription factor n=1 Tax=Parafrankia sp. EUN1f TaxID=102897 RepID=UPI0001C471B0|nr:LuxR family transcriptional regulator [Parafrankia sp. EUN1f]EFC79463.1 transcriptional regulator, LuxR family [Parafrankia sp. EUN1f]
MLRQLGTQDNIVATIMTPAGRAGLLLVLTPRPGTFTSADRDVIALLARHIGHLLHARLPRTPAPTALAALSHRERDVIELVASGHSNQQIADTLDVTVHTVKHHVTNVMRTTQCANRTQLALLWHRSAGTLITDDPKPPDLAPPRSRTVHSG